jgi:integrase
MPTVTRGDDLDEDRRISKHLLAEFGEQTELPAITAAKVNEFKGKLLRAITKWRRGGELSVASINRPLALLRGLLKLACEEWEMLPTVPKIKLEKEPLGRLMSYRGIVKRKPR